MNIDELITNIESDNFESSLDSMTEQELSDLYQRLLDADDELQVRLTDLQESEPKPSQEEFEEVVANKRKIEDANQKVSEKWAQLLNPTPVNEQTPEQAPQNIEEDFTEISNNVNSVEKPRIERNLDRINEVNELIKTRTEQLYDENTPYVEMDPEIIALNGELTSLNNEVNIERNEVYAYVLNYRKSTLEADLKNANDRYNARGDELAANGVDYTSQFMDPEYNSLANEINSIQGEINNLNGYTEMYPQTRLGGLERQLADANASLAEVNANLDERMNTLADEGNNYPQMDQEVINLNGQITALNAQIVTINNSIHNMQEEIRKNAYYLRVEELKQDLSNASKKIEEKEIELDNNNVSYDDRYMDQDYINVCRERDYIQKQIDDLKYKYDNNLLTDEIFNQINLSELPKKTNENTQTNQNGSTQAGTNESAQSNENENAQSDENNNTQTDTNDNSNDVENQIKDLEEKLKACAERMQKAREEGNEQAYAEERSRFNYLTQEINKSKQNQQSNTKDNSNDIENQIKDLEEKLKACAERMQKAKEEGNEQAYAEEKSRYNYLTQEINNLKGKNQQQKASSEGNNSGNNESENKDEGKDNEKKDDQDLDPNKNDEEKDNEKTEEEKKEERKQKIKKAAIGVLGGAIGFGLSFVLQPGTAGTVISVGRLVYSAAKKGLKVYTEKHKDDENNKIIKMVGKVKEFTKEQAEKHPKITSAISKVNNFLKKPETQVFLNGMAAGYTIGKLSQLVYKMHEASAIEKNIPDNTEVENNSEVGKTQPEFMDKVPDIDTQPDIPTPDPVPEPTFDPTKPVDLSSLGEGYVSSYSSDPVSLITSAGKNAMFDKINVVDGKTWVHFTQGNGAGYAWFPAEDVLNALDLSDISELTGEVSGGMHL